VACHHLCPGVHDDGGEENAEVDFFKDMEPEVKVKKVN